MDVCCIYKMAENHNGTFWKMKKKNLSHTSVIRLLMMFLFVGVAFFLHFTSCILFNLFSFCFAVCFFIVIFLVRVFALDICILFHSLSVSFFPFRLSPHWCFICNLTLKRMMCTIFIIFCFFFCCCWVSLFYSIAFRQEKGKKTLFWNKLPSCVIYLQFSRNIFMVAPFQHPYYELNCNVD